LRLLFASYSAPVASQAANEAKEILEGFPVALELAGSSKSAYFQRRAYFEGLKASDLAALLKHNHQLSSGSKLEQAVRCAEFEGETHLPLCWPLFAPAALLHCHSSSRCLTCSLPRSPGRPTSLPALQPRGAQGVPRAQPDRRTGVLRLRRPAGGRRCLRALQLQCVARSQEASVAVLRR